MIYRVLEEDEINVHSGFRDCRLSTHATKLHTVCKLSAALGAKHPVQRYACAGRKSRGQNTFAACVYICHACVPESLYPCIPESLHPFIHVSVYACVRETSESVIFGKNGFLETNKEKKEK